MNTHEHQQQRALHLAPLRQPKWKTRRKTWLHGNTKLQQPTLPWR